jgi:glycosyltransferase involved in cell wall biosynthesis
MSEPRVSVLLVSRDGERFLDAALDGLAAQTYRDFEVIAVDDGSSDGTAARFEAFAARHPRVRPLRTTGIGLAAALAHAAQHARGELLARHDDDDRSLPERFARQVGYLDAHPEVGVLGTAADVIDAEGRRLSSYPVPLSPGAIRAAARRVPPFVHGSVMMRRDPYRHAGGYRAAFGASQDLDLWFRWPADSAMANLAEPLYQWRMHPGSVFGRARERQLFFAALAREFAAERRELGADSYALLERDPRPEAFLAAYSRAGPLRLRLGEAYVREGRVAEARRLLAIAMRAPGSRAAALGWWLLSWPVAFTPRAARARLAEATA